MGLQYEPPVAIGILVIHSMEKQCCNGYKAILLQLISKLKYSSFPHSMLHTTLNVYSHFSTGHLEEIIELKMCVFIDGIILTSWPHVILKHYKPGIKVNKLIL